ncbi:hypothetical protein EB796_006795 [Bugula neritina]|uniref:Uncharacterized protein n=1 Tax=Bugula neritina TaxID=10212 RepID=A0A7J7K9J3_BUGNE|nr:hypothetical protein EB796_006795 [Bugula neritina]
MALCQALYLLVPNSPIQPVSHDITAATLPVITSAQPIIKATQSVTATTQSTTILSQPIVTFTLQTKTTTHSINMLTQTATTATHSAPTSTKLATTATKPTTEGKRQPSPATLAHYTTDSLLITQTTKPLKGYLAKAARHMEASSILSNGNLILEGVVMCMGGVRSKMSGKEQPKAAKSEMVTEDQPKSEETSSAAEITLASVMYGCLILLSLG